ncbi:MAG: Na(+)/H(+) antiporter subunit D [Chloroflexi bacterium]|nr:Na(+)/H(+) antiporter subunit D [Chloroflexota bacterium]
MSNFPPAGVFLVGALLLPLVPRRVRAVALLMPPVASLVLLWILEPGQTLTVPFLDFQLLLTRVDRLSLAFGYVFVIVTFLGGVYGLHLKDVGQQVAALLYSGSALGVVFAGDLFTLFVFWEVMAVASVYLIWARGTKRSRQAGYRYLFVHMAGGSLLLAGALIHYNATGSLLFEPMKGGLGATLILVSFAINAAIPPLHAWLPDAYPQGTVTGSVFLSAFTTKAAVYALARGFAGWEVLVWAGTAMAVYGVVYAVLENDIRGILAYHIVSQVGYMVAGVGLGTEVAINGTTAHAFTHILYKGLLFMGAGTVLYATGRSKLTELGGLWRALPLALGLYMVGAFSISGFPLFSGFVSKSMTVYAAEVDHRGLVVLLLNLASVGTFLHTGLKLPYFTWFGPSRPAAPQTRVPWNMYAGMGLAAAINIAIGLYPGLLYELLPFPVDYRPYTFAHVSETLQLLLFTGLGFWLLIKMLKGEPIITLDTDWFYRRPARLVYVIAVVYPSHLFATTERIALRLVQSLVSASRDPIAALNAATVTLFGRYPDGRMPRRRHNTGDYDPDRYRLPVGVMGLVILALFVALMLWILLAR